MTGSEREPFQSMPITILDLVVLGVIAISALLAAVRGFTREVLAIVSWVAAAAVVFTSYRVIFSNRSVIRACLSAGASARMAATRSSERG